MSKDTKHEIELCCIDCGETSVLSQTGKVSPEASAAARLSRNPARRLFSGPHAVLDAGPFCWTSDVFLGDTLKNLCY
jgi:hypothetical protein